MTWNWQLPDWPIFSYSISELDTFECQFLQVSGIRIGAFKHLNENGRTDLKIRLLAQEGYNTSAIEGEILNRDSLQASMARQLGLSTQKMGSTPAETGMAEMMIDAYQDYDLPLSESLLFKWHEQIMRGRRDLAAVACYRTHPEAMQIISGHYHDPTIHFEAPSSNKIKSEMNRFIKWFNETGPNKNKSLPPLARAGLIHIYFESIHPFEDGNGRIGRALTEKALSQSLGEPLLTSLSQIIQNNKKNYYQALGKASITLEMTDWLIYFSETILAGIQYTQSQIEFMIAQTHFFTQHDTKLNERQRKVLLGMFKMGPEGFEGGLSAENYRAIGKTSPATATRDLNELVELGCLYKKGQLRHTRYYLVLS